MFTSRAEHRLLLRIDNADLRLTPRGREVGLVDDERWQSFESRRARFSRNLSTLDQTTVRSAKGDRVTVAQLLQQPEVRLAGLIDRQALAIEVDASRPDIDLASVETTVKYAGYLKQETSRVERAERQERRRIPHDFPFARVPGLSREAIERLTQVRPESLGQASRIPGMTPAAVAVLSTFLGRLSPDRLAPTDDSGTSASLQ
jgi:tRNA uridine 5-carboxymethylaminomethyl modification enzyme